MSEEEPTKSRIIHRAAVLCGAALLLFGGWELRRTLITTGLDGYRSARQYQMLSRVAGLFPEDSTEEARLVRYRFKDKSFMWANYVLLARFEGADTGYVDGLRAKYCPDDSDDPALRKWEGDRRWERWSSLLRDLGRDLPSRRADFEYCPVSYTPIPGNNHTESFVWLEKGGRTAILFGEYYSG